MSATGTLSVSLAAPGPVSTLASLAVFSLARIAWKFRGSESISVFCRWSLGGGGASCPAGPHSEADTADTFGITGMVASGGFTAGNTGNIGRHYLNLKIFF